MDIIELLSVECDFCVEVNRKNFFKQSFFPILEFLNCYLKWDKCCDFVYNAIESAENPMLSFKKQLNFWKIDSVWKQFNCEANFAINDFIIAANALCYDLSNDIN